MSSIIMEAQLICPVMMASARVDPRGTPATHTVLTRMLKHRKVEEKLLLLCTEKKHGLNQMNLSPKDRERERERENMVRERDNRK